VSSILAAVLLLPGPALAQKKKPPPAKETKDTKDTKGTTESSADDPPRVADGPTIDLAIGENKTISAEGVRNYSEGAPGVAEVKLTSDGSAFVVVGLKAGTTTLLLIKKNGQEVTWNINVFARSPQIVENELRQLLDGYNGVKIRRIGARFFIEGSVANEADVKRIAHVAQLYAGQVESLVGIGATKDRTNIRIDFFFVQYSKDSGYQLGVSWPTRIGGESITSTFGYDFVAGTRTAVTNVVNQPLPGLDIASRYGWAKVLKQATVITTNGNDALLDAGGEQNFSVANGLTSAIQKISFGTSVVVQPFFDPVTREVEVRVQADVSDLTPSNRATSLPGRTVTKLQTVVHLKLGQALVISGIHTQEERRAVDGLPGLKDIPLLGVLFGSQQRSASELEGAVFIIPSVVAATSKQATDLIEETMRTYEKWSGSPIVGDRPPPAFDHRPSPVPPAREGK
jgi:pilus assembly protein CpaC